jgi:hypothetical protein
MNFMIGDQVSFGGMIGAVVDIDLGKPFGTIVRFEDRNKTEMCFTRDGKLHESQTESLLKIIKRPTPKSITRWVNLYNNGEETYYSTEEKAEFFEKRDQLIARVKLTGQYNS